MAAHHDTCLHDVNRIWTCLQNPIFPSVQHILTHLKPRLWHTPRTVAGLLASLLLPLTEELLIHSRKDNSCTDWEVPRYIDSEPKFTLSAIQSSVDNDDLWQCWPEGELRHTCSQAATQESRLWERLGQPLGSLLQPEHHWGLLWKGWSWRWRWRRVTSAVTIPGAVAIPSSWTPRPASTNISSFHPAWSASWGWCWFWCGW